MPSSTKPRRFSTSGIAADGMPTFAFAFDIDGVLLRSSSAIPGAAEALGLLHENNIPFILLTNGGGKHESTRVAELSKKLGVPLTEENFVQSHTPFKQLVEGTASTEGLQDKTILVTGGDGDKCRKVAEILVLTLRHRYGFKNVVTPGDILMAHPNIWPFNQIFSDYYHNNTRPLPVDVNQTSASESLKIDAIFVFNDPRDWALDSQIILDLLLSKQGYLGTYSDKNGDTSLPNNGWQQDGQPKLFFSNPDLFWATNYHMPRLGQGGFQAAVQGVWDATTGGAQLERTVIGKPHPATYKYAERVLNKHRTQMLGGSGEVKKKVIRLERVFMVGDNPESDIRGANEYNSTHGTEWTSVLVKTGVFRDGTKPAYTPKVIVDDVLEAVTWALKAEGWKGSLE
ncbi:HAD-like domain-containing protein [Halenospora varia]|nr:HAD-like domain-containing protein [Halenospora varia]